MVTENIECLAIAVIITLILNIFFLQAYKIPTGSMQPTIFGNEERNFFDRILVNKFLYLVSDPERWDVIVFKYPLDQSKNYIKRLIGLPGEEVTIARGDILINGKVERKPENAICSTLKQIFPGHEEGIDYFHILGASRAEEPDGVVFTGPGSLSTKSRIFARYLDGYDPSYQISKPEMSVDESQLVGDLRVAFTATLADGSGCLQVEIRESGKEHVFVLQGESLGELSRISTGPCGEDEGEVRALPELRLEAGKSYHIACSNIDDCLTLRVDGEEVARCEYDYPGADWRPLGNTNRVTFGLEGCGGKIQDIELFRDIYYLSGKDPLPVTFQVPEGHFFAMGDNTQSSSDGRYWTAAKFIRRDGTELKGNFDRSATPNPRQGAGGFLVTDRFGDERYLAPSMLARRRFDLQAEPFIPRELMLGKALVVFWPIFPHFRWKLIR
jgi:signal peptidase I